MGGSSSKNCLVKFRENLSKNDYKHFSSYFDYYWDIDGCLWNTWNFEQSHISMRIYGMSLNYEFIYQISLIPVLGRTTLIRGVGSFGENETHYNHVLSIKLGRFPHLIYSKINFQAKIYVVIDENRIRKWYFRPTDIYGELKIIRVEGGALYVPFESIAKRAPLLAVAINKAKLRNEDVYNFESFVQIVLGVQVQLEPDQFKPLLKLAAKYEVFNVKHYCGQQLIRRDDLGFSNLQKYRMARKFNLIHLMHNLLNGVESIEVLVKFARREINGKLVDANMTKLIIGRMYELD